MNAEMKEAVRAYCDLGWVLTRVQANSKVPATVSAEDAQSLETWEGNVGVRLGGPQRLVVLDLDGTWAHAEDVRQTVAQRTPHGVHAFFRWPEGSPLPKTHSSLEHRVDFKGAGALVVLAPSVVLRQKYEWLPGQAPTEREVALAPTWLVEQVTALEAVKPLPVPTKPVAALLDELQQRFMAYDAKASRMDAELGPNNSAAETQAWERGQQRGLATAYRIAHDLLAAALAEAEGVDAVAP